MVLLQSIEQHLESKELGDDEEIVHDDGVIIEFPAEHTFCCDRLLAKQKRLEARGADQVWLSLRRSTTRVGIPLGSDVPK